MDIHSSNSQFSAGKPALHKASVPKGHFGIIFYPASTSLVDTEGKTIRPVDVANSYADAISAAFAKGGSAVVVLPDFLRYETHPIPQRIQCESQSSADPAAA